MKKDKENSEQPSAEKESDGQHSGDLVIAVITFIVFVLFMTVWMYFGEVQ